MSPNQIYREKASRLRAAAQETSNFAISVELDAAADRYDRLADVAENRGAQAERAAPVIGS